MRLFDFEFGQLRRYDFRLAAMVLGLAIVGVLLIWGSSGQVDSLTYEPARKQIFRLFIGLAAFLFCHFVDLKTVEWAGVPLYAVTVIMMIGLLYFGEQVGGAQSWYSFSVINIQPSEYAKIATVIVLASYLARNRETMSHARGLIAPALIVGIPMLLTVMQNDLGTALVFAPIFVAMVYMAGVPKRLLAGLFAVLLIVSILGLRNLQDYQLRRIVNVIGERPSELLIKSLGRDFDSIWGGANRATRWQMEQAQIALGSGRVFGKGWGQGTQTGLRFVPKFHNDLIFVSLGEQFGLLGCLALLALYMMMLWRGARIALEARDMFSSMLVVGLMMIFFSHVVINVGMAVGLLPIIGLPLPFISYGGSFLLTQFIVFGLALNVGTRKFLY